MKQALVVLFLLFCLCSCDPAKDAVEKEPITSPDSAFSKASNDSLALEAAELSGMHEEVTYRIFMRAGKDSKVGSYKSACDTAVALMNLVYNSREFQDSLKMLSFRCDAYCGGCDSITSNGFRIPGAQVLDLLFRYKQVSWNIVIEQKGNVLGETRPYSNQTKAYLIPIHNDMPELSRGFGLGVNLCHEYTHQLGFCHLYNSKAILAKNRLQEKDGKPDPKWYNEDVSYRVGWIAYNLTRKWVREGRL